MNLSKLAKQLRREAKANPKKAALLGLLVLVALYYWGPMMWGWVAADEATGSPPDAPTTAAVASLGAATPGTLKPPSTPEDKSTGTPPWTHLDEWMTQDPMTAPVEDVTGWHDPFAVAAAEPQAVEPDDAQNEQLLLSPEDLGIELSGTLVGPHRRVALIGGKAYREGQTVNIDRDGQSIEFQLAEVHSRRIVLGREGRRFDLRIPDRNTPGGPLPAKQEN
jgi:hypothetical protein